MFPHKTLTLPAWFHTINYYVGKHSAMQGDGAGFKSEVAMIVDGSRIIDFVPEAEADAMYKAEKNFTEINGTNARFNERRQAIKL